MGIKAMSENEKWELLSTIVARIDSMDSRICNLATREEVRELAQNIRTMVWGFFLVLAAAVLAAALK